MKTTFLFTYGRLEVGEDLQPRIKSSVRDTVSGEMYDLKKFPAAVNIGQTSLNYIRGETLEIDESELKAIDADEGPDFKRVKITTDLGYDAWAYVYTKPIPDSAKMINSWEDTKDSLNYRRG